MVRKCLPRQRENVTEKVGPVFPAGVPSQARETALLVCLEKKKKAYDVKCGGRQSQDSINPLK